MLPAEGSQLGASFYWSRLFNHTTKIYVVMSREMTLNRSLPDFNQLLKTGTRAVTG